MLTAPRVWHLRRSLQRFRDVGEAARRNILVRDRDDDLFEPFVLRLLRGGFIGGARGIRVSFRHGLRCESVQRRSVANDNRKNL